MDCSLDIDGAPERNCGRNEGEAARTVEPLLETTVSDFSKTAEEDRSSGRVEGFSIVQTGINAPAKLDALQPGKEASLAEMAPELTIERTRGLSSDETANL